MPPRRILILGGTRDARDLAGELLQAGYAPVTSLAGVTSAPLLPPGELRLGGFGGAEGLARHLAEAGYALVIDATHPFAARMSRHAAEACAGLSLPLFRLERPAWQPSDGDQWIGARSAIEAAAILPEGARVLLTIGGKEADVFFQRPDLSGIARMIETPPCDPPPGWQLLLERPPFGLAAETALIARHAITHLVSKNAGGAMTEAKLKAARISGITVVMIARPDKPRVPQFASAEQLLEAVKRVLSP